MRIALLQHDDDLASRIIAWLADDGHLVTRFADPARLADALAGGRWDLLIADDGLPDTPGDSLRQAVRRAAVPVLALVKRSRTQARAARGDAAADAFVCRPVRRRELAARVRAMRRAAGTQPAAGASTTFGPFRFDTVARRVTRRGLAVDLTPREFELALYLCRNANRVLSRECLLEHVWGAQSRELNTRTVDTHVSRLRKKLGLDEFGWRLASVYDHGYRLEAPPGRD